MQMQNWTCLDHVYADAKVNVFFQTCFEHVNFKLLFPGHFLCNILTSNLARKETPLTVYQFLSTKDVEIQRVRIDNVPWQD